MASGRPDWYSSVAMHGKYLETQVGIAVDVLGHMLAKMQGEGPGGLDTIALDAAGNMKANLSAQDLANISVVPLFGEAGYETGNQVVEGLEEDILFTIEGRGTIYSGYVYWVSVATSWNDIVSVYIDGDYFYSVNPATCRTRGQYYSGIAPLYLAYASNATNVEYCIRCTPGITFDESFQVRIDPATAEDITVFWFWNYALV